MPQYEYIALDARGKETKGTVEVATQSDAISRVKDMGLFPTKIVEAEAPQTKGAAKKSKPGAKKGGKKGGGMQMEIKIPFLTGRP